MGNFCRSLSGGIVEILGSHMAENNDVSSKNNLTVDGKWSERYKKE